MRLNVPAIGSLLSLLIIIYSVPAVTFDDVTSNCASTNRVTPVTDNWPYWSPDILIFNSDPLFNIASAVFITPVIALILSYFGLIIEPLSADMPEFNVPEPDRVCPLFISKDGIFAGFRVAPVDRIILPDEAIGLLLVVSVKVRVPSFISVLPLYELSS